jgi:hypothetical protein
MGRLSGASALGGGAIGGGDASTTVLARLTGAARSRLDTSTSEDVISSPKGLSPTPTPTTGATGNGALDGEASRSISSWLMTPGVNAAWSNCQEGTNASASRSASSGARLAPAPSPLAPAFRAALGALPPAESDIVVLVKT